MISKVRHGETTQSGEPLYIIEAHFKERDDKGVETISPEINKDFEKTRYGIPFHKGIGRTQHQRLAQWCSEQFDMVVRIHKDVKPWVEAKSGSNPGAITDLESDAGFYEPEEEDLGTTQEDYANL